jgi:hypothetical protein
MLIFVYHLPTMVNKLPFSVCRKQTEVCHFCFLFAINKWKLSLSVSSISRFYLYSNSSIYTYIYIYIFQTENRKRKPRQFYSLICLRFAHYLEVRRFSVCLGRNKGKLSVCKQTKQTCSSYQHTVCCK